MVVVRDVGTSEVGGLAGLVAVGRKAVFNLNIASPRRHIQQVADKTYPAESVESKKEAPSKMGRWCFFLNWRCLVRDSEGS